MIKLLGSVLFCLSTVSTTAQARVAVSRSGQASIMPTATLPIIISCPSGSTPRAACFGVFVSVRAISGPAKIAWLSSNKHSYWAMQESSAYLTSGATCDARMGTDMPQARKWSDERLTMTSSAPSVTRDIPYRFPLTFNCDQEVTSSDRVTAQITLVESIGGVDRDGNTPGRLVQFGLDDMPFASVGQVFNPEARH